MELKKVCVLGTGSWATALVKILCDAQYVTNINWYFNKEEDISFIKEFKHNPRYLSDVSLDLDKINIQNNLEKAINESDLILFAIPSAFVCDSINMLKKDIFQDKFILSAVKGVIPQKNQIMSTYFTDEWGISETQIAAVSGPCHAEEVALEKLSYLTIASQNSKLTNALLPLFDCHYIFTKISEDIYGMEYAAVLKNVYAICCGICHGIGYGDNFQAVLVSSAIREMEKFLQQAHPMLRDVKENMYLGDLLVTAYSQFSRNRTFGNMLGKGYSVQSAQAEMNMIAEGYYATKTMFEVNQIFKAEMPILESVYKIIYLKQNARQTMKALVDKLI